MKAEELINNNALTDIAVCDGQKVVAVEIALTAVNMAKMEEGKRAIEAFEQFFKYCAESGKAGIVADEEHYMNVFKTLLEGSHD